MGFNVSYIPQNGYFYEVRELYKKKGSKWVLVKADTERLTVAEYARSCDLAKVKMFKARRTFTFCEYGRICNTFSAISPDKSEKIVSNYYSPRQWERESKIRR